MTKHSENTKPRNSSKPVLCEVTLSDLKIRFEKWSGFTFKSENLDDVCAEIESMKYQLECEISDYARVLRQIAEKSFHEE